MTPPHKLAVVSATILFASTGIQSVSAQLPILEKEPWLGYFAVSENRRCQFRISSHGIVTVAPLNPKGKPVGQKLLIPIAFGIEEIQPDGKTVMKQIKVESLKSAETPTDELEKTVISGKVTGDAAFEVFFEQDRGIFMIGGRVTDSGALTKYPLRFTVRVKIPNVYETISNDDKKELKAFEKKIKSDRIDLKWTDGKRIKQTFEEPVDTDSKEINGPGIASAEIEISSYNGEKFYFSASPNSAITLSGGAHPGPLYQGFTLNWQPDAAKDPQCKARLAIQVK